MTDTDSNTIKGSLSLSVPINKDVPPGGTFPMPPAAAGVCALMPPPTSFRGPFVAVDRLMHLFNRISLPDSREYTFMYNPCVENVKMCEN
jgi:hypothetical protein